MAQIDKDSLKIFLAEANKDILVTSKKMNKELKIKEAEKRFKKILQSEISKLTIESKFMMKLEGVVTISTRSGDSSFTIEISFAERVHRRSIFYDFTGKEVYMPYVLNNEWKRKPKRSYTGYDENGKLVHTVVSFPSSNKGFMNRAIKRFNEEFAKDNIVAEANINYL